MWRQITAYTLIGLALVYAFLAGFRTVADFDLGWQLATGRYVLDHKLIPRTDVFSYTAQGAAAAGSVTLTNSWSRASSCWVSAAFGS